MATRTSATERDETPSERADRNLAELLQELRVALPGVQVLFAFLLIVPFNQGFESVTAVQEKVYFGVLMCTALAAAFLVAPSMNHRILFRQGDKDHLVRISHKFTIVGLTLLAVAMTGAVVLVTDIVFEGVMASVAAAALAIVFLWLWYALPLMRLRELGRREGGGEGASGGGSS
jgi:Family of unknown function (DUF6328)